MFESGDTYDQPWTLTSTDAIIEKIVLDGFPGNVVFDISTVNDFFTQKEFDESGKQGTTGSELGRTFEVISVGTSFSGKVNVTYSSLVNLMFLNTNNNKWVDLDPVGDLYRYLTIDFGTTPLAGTTLKFYADTDKMKAPVPEPATMLLFATGLAGLAAVGRRRRS